MTYEEMEREINAIPKFGAKASLSNLRAYLDAMNHPERNLRVIHVAGTNGKGSVCAFIESILRRAGYRTALFTSPHLVRMSERFRIDFRECEERELVAAWQRVKGLMQGGEKAGRQPLTFFEILFLMSMDIFSKREVDYCILETGLGGRLDATVLCEPVLCIITSISFDHTKILGNTIEEIAGEKAGIIKNGVPIVTMDKENGAFSVIERTAAEKKAPLYFLKKKNLTILKKSHNNIDFSINSRYYKRSGLTIASAADYQVENAALAVLATHILLPKLSEAAFREGLCSMRWAGRMEELADRIYVDGAHNPGAIAQICGTVMQSGEDWTLLFAVCEDKDYAGMIEMLAHIPWKRIYITRIEGARGASVEAVRRQFCTVTDAPLRSFATVPEAFFAALADKKEAESLLCLGSLYLVGEIKHCEAQWRVRGGM